MKKILAGLLAVVLLTGGFFVLQNVNVARQADLARLELPAQARPDLLTNVLMSVGRALAVDYLWIGLQKMQEDGRYFDAYQRSEWICQLQPHFTSVWINHAWNMSYNISVAMTSGADRWRWVRNGYELLRDRGIPLNPKSVGMYQQLAWIFHHKIGMMSDDYHWYYKIQLARAMEDVIGWPNPNYDAIAKAPATFDLLVADPAMKEYTDKIRAFQIDPEQKFLYVLSHRSEFGEKVIALLDDPAWADARTRLEGFLRAKRLRDEWKMDPKLMGEIRTAKMYGPLDFRTPEAHAIYWSYAGLRATDQETSFEALNTDRVVYGSMQELVRRGHFVVLGDDQPPLVAPDIRFIPILNRIYLSLGKKWAANDNVTWDGTAGPTFKDGHINFLRKAIGLCYQYGGEKVAMEYWNALHKLYPYVEPNTTMREFVNRSVREDIRSMGFSDVNDSVVACLGDSYARYAMGDDYSALAMKRYAQTIYDAYQKDRDLKGEADSNRMTLAPFKILDDYSIKLALQRLSPEFQERLRARLNLPADNATAPAPH